MHYDAFQMSKVFAKAAIWLIFLIPLGLFLAFLVINLM